MLSKIFSQVSNIIAEVTGSGILGRIIKFSGKLIGQYIDYALHKPTYQYKEQGQSDEISVPYAVNNQIIPTIFGKAKIDGKIIWAKTKERQISVSNTKYFKDSNFVKSETNTKQFYYQADFAIGLCNGEIEPFLSAVWINGKSQNLSNYKYRFYTGSEIQIPDPLLIDEYGEEKAPSFRGLAYIIFEDFPLAEYHNQIPNVSVEVNRKIKGAENSVEDLITAIAIIPGSGEFVYDPVIQSKKQSIFKDHIEIMSDEEHFNCHNNYAKSNAALNLDQMSSTFPNLKYVAPVVTWFGDSLDVANCNIVPLVEFNSPPNTTYSEAWKVANYTRENCKMVSRDQDGNLHYGGTINDASVLRYLQQLKAKGLKVMFYPMLMMDLPAKPWRGHLTGEAHAVENFFTKDKGYNQFILHYANLVKSEIDVFIIGSELIGITKIKDANNNFPAIKQLKNLASMIRKILPPEVKITYAADWSEYHHTDGGYYNLDDLWSDENIDFVGIDAYFPITNVQGDNLINKEEIIRGWNSGEGYDYYYDNEEQKRLEPAYAWKNIKYWWESQHRNPDGTITSWQPKMKKIWFTEFGFPSIDKASNKPNVFWNPKCVDGGVPKYSNGNVDFRIQRVSIEATLEFWSGSEFLEEQFLWAWDARPYPIFPHFNVWGDSDLWSRGHWVNGKLGGNTLSQIIKDIIQKANISIPIECISLDTIVDGFILDKEIDILGAFNLLRCAYFFDIQENEEKIRFISRGFGSRHHISYEELYEDYDMSKIADSQNLGDISIDFIDPSYGEQHYKKNYVTTYDSMSTGQSHIKLNLPILLNDSQAQNIADTILANAKQENTIIRFAYNELILPCDLIHLVNLKGDKYLLRVIESEFKDGIIAYTGVTENLDIYNNLNYAPLPILSVNTVKPLNFKEKLIALELPILYGLLPKTKYLHLAYQSNFACQIYLSLYDIEDSFYSSKNLSGMSNIGIVVDFDSNLEAVDYLIDEKSKFLIYSSIPLQEPTESDFWLGKSIALIGKEIVSFQKCKAMNNNLYEISHLIRGQCITEKEINSHRRPEQFVLLNHEVAHIAIDSKADKIFYKHKDQILNVQLDKPSLLPVIIEDGNYNATAIFLKLSLRNSYYDNWHTQYIYEGSKLFGIIESSNSQEIKIELKPVKDKANLYSIDITNHKLSGPIKIAIIAEAKNYLDSPLSTYELNILN